jgi:Uncharacterized conserved protein (DUF2293)
VSLAERIASANALGVDDATAPQSEALKSDHLDIYATKDGPWNPDYGEIEIRVGRTRKLSLDERAVLSVRAYIRHSFTSYHDDFDAVSPERWDEEYLYREIKGTANEAADHFLLEHRRPLK